MGLWVKDLGVMWQGGQMFWIPPQCWLDSCVLYKNWENVTQQNDLVYRFTQWRGRVTWLLDSVFYRNLLYKVAGPQMSKHCRDHRSLWSGLIMNALWSLFLDLPTRSQTQMDWGSPSSTIKDLSFNSQLTGTCLKILVCICQKWIWINWSIWNPGQWNINGVNASSYLCW